MQICGYSNSMNKILEKYDAYCKAEKVRPSEPRRFVLNIIAGSDKPLTAYEILDMLGQYIKSPKPPTVYRALESLGEYGFIHRIESLNAYLACHENHRHNGSQFLICDSCRNVQEIHLCSIPESLQKQALSKDFSVRYWNVELHGLCTACTNVT
jgi:Fur family transcriptional regulator, zinc uptake regulator